MQRMDRSMQRRRRNARFLLAFLFSCHPEIAYPNGWRLVFRAAVSRACQLLVALLPEPRGRGTFLRISLRLPALTRHPLPFLPFQAHATLFTPSPRRDLGHDQQQQDEEQQQQQLGEEEYTA